MRRTSVISILAVLVVLVALVAGFIGTRLAERNMDRIVLPDPQEDDLDDSGLDIFAGGAAPGRVTVTTENVLELVDSLARPDEYSAEAEVSVYWESGESSSTRLLWVRDGLSRVESGEMNYIVSGDYTYIWEDGGDGYYRGNTAEFSADSAAGIPTYEDIGGADILDCGAVELDGIPCLWIRTSDGALCDWYIDLESGLLRRMERFSGETLNYRADILLLSTERAEDSYFTLPDGTPVSGS